MAKTMQVVYADDEAYMRSIVQLGVSDALQNEKYLDHEFIAEVVALGVERLAEDMDERGLELTGKSQWHVFDKDDTRSWPSANWPTGTVNQLRCWTVTPDGHARYIDLMRWHGPESWAYVSHWQEVIAPEPPK